MNGWMDKTSSWRTDQGNVSSGWTWTSYFTTLLLRNAWSPHLCIGRYSRRPLENSIECIYSNGLGHFLYKFLLSHGGRGEQQDVTGWSNISMGEKKRPASQNPKWEKKSYNWLEKKKKQKIFPIRKATS